MTRDTEYAQALRAAIRARLAGKTTVAEYLARCEHLAGMHDRVEDRARFARERVAILSSAEEAGMARAGA